jgi:hypothetical protein
MENEEMKNTLISIFLVLLVGIGYGSWKYEIFTGYYEFKQACTKDSGLQIFEKIEKNVGWEADSLSKARAYQRQLDYVAFVRAPNDVRKSIDFNLGMGELVDVTFKGGAAWGVDSSYNMPRADLSIATRYRITSFVEPENSSQQLNKTTHQILDIKTGKVEVQWIQYSYKWRIPDQPFLSLLGPDGIARCPNSDATTNFAELNSNIFMN